MQVIKPVVFNNAMLISTNATDATAVYNAGTTYAQNAEVLFNDKIYVSLQNSNLNKTPDVNPTWWQYKSASNLYKMFDEKVTTRTTRASSLEVVVAPGDYTDSIAFINLVGVTSVQVVGRDGLGGTIVFNQTYNLDNTDIVDWYDYFFSAFDTASELVVYGIPPYLSMHLTITFTSTSTVEVGSVIFGNLKDLGLTQYGLTAGIRDFSVKSVDDFGDTFLLKRNNSNRVESKVILKKKNFNSVSRALKDLAATPAIWIPVEDAAYSTTITYGYFRDFNLEISYPTYSLCSLEIEGLT